MNAADAQNIRKSVYDGRFYPKNPDTLIDQINHLTKLAKATSIALPADKTLKALIMPHAGYIYSGLTAAHASFALKEKQYDKLIIIGPDHRVGFTGCAISDAIKYETPLGSVMLHKDAATLRRQYKSLFHYSLKSDQTEHSLEVLLPFLQHNLHQFKIIPIVMGRVNTSLYIDPIDFICDDDTLIVVSSDLSHYLSYADAVNMDNETIRLILNLNDNQLSKNRTRACGLNPVRLLVQLARRHRWKPILLHYSNSGDTAGSKDSVVGYATIAFYEDPSLSLKKSPLQKGSYQKGPKQKGIDQMDEIKGALLVKLARKTIADELGINTEKPNELKTSLSDDIFKSRRGTFVTLKINQQLRGCIGNLSPDKTIIEGVKDNAINAAFHDPRFPALSRQEFDQMDIEISLLTEPQHLEYSDENDLLDKLRVNIDGVILKKGYHRSTFLPQVWEQLPDKKMFLEHLCLKAGLSADEWRKPGLEIMVYQVQYFEEGH